MSIKDWSEIPGWFNYLKFYDEIADRLPNKATCAEVGTWLGRSACYLASKNKSLRKSVTIFCVDQWSGLEIPDPTISHPMSLGFMEKFIENVNSCGHSDVIIPVISDSDKAAERFCNSSFDFVFLDASHDYASVKRDISAWIPKLKTSGIIAGHDYDWAGVKQAVCEMFTEMGTKEIGNVWVVSKG